jgi:hypothetical protein
MSDLLHFAEHRLQEVALVIMGLVYTARLIWLFSWKGGKERQAPTGQRDTSRAKGALYSIANVAMPWGMESYRKNPLFYAQFVIFHLGVVTSITLSFVIPYAPQLLTPTVVLVVQVICAAACIVGILRMIRRISQPVMRLISTPDDYFSLTLMTVWFAFSTLAAPNNYAAGEGVLLAYFFLTAFFLIYVPFSKISHYLYYPFARYWLGKTLGHRGVYPMTRSVKPAPVQADVQLALSEQKEG